MISIGQEYMYMFKYWLTTKVPVQENYNTMIVRRDMTTKELKVSTQ